MLTDTKRTPSGIDQLGELSWGSHFCLFYETGEDLLDVLIPYFKAGLQNHEYCLCITSEPVIAEEVERALHKAAPDFERTLRERQIEIIPHLDWYLNGGHFDPRNVRQGWMDKLNEALAWGYAGMRFIANISWLEQQEWNHFAEYEGTLDEVFRPSKMIGICAYSLERCLAVGVLDVVRHHQFTLARRHGVWESLQGTELRHARDEVQKLNTDLERLVWERTAELATATEQLRRESLERKQTEEALKESRERLQLALQAAKIGTGEWNIQANQSSVSNGLEQIFGFAPGTFHPSFAEYVELIHPEDRELFRTRIDEALAGKNDFVLDYRIVWPDGSVHWIASQARIFFDDTGKPTRLVGAAMDITERKQVEEALRISEQKLADSQRLAHVGHWERDADSGVITWSDEVYRIFGISPEEEPSLTVARLRELIHPDDQENVLHTVTEALQGGPRYNVEYRVIRPNGAVRIVHSQGDVILDDSGKPQRVFGVVQDITERKRVEEELRKYELIFSHTPDGISLLDRNYRYQSVNRVYEKFSGIKREQFVGRTVREYLGEQVFEEYVKPNFDRCLQGEVIHYQEWFHYPTLGKRFVDVTYFPFIDADDQIAGVVAMSRDITERVRMEDALRESEHKLNEAERIAHIGYWERDYQADRLTWSAETYRILGISPEDQVLTATRAWEFVHPEDRQRVEDSYNRALRDGSGFSIEYRVVRPNDEVRIIHTQGTATCDESGQPRRIFGVVQDVTEHKRAEEAIKESEERLKLAFEAAKIGTGEMDLEANQITCSDAMQQVMGFAPGTFNPTFPEFAERVYSEDRARVQQVVEGAKAGQPEINIEYRIVWPDGSLHWVTSRAKTIYDASGKAIRLVGALMDITEIKQVEEALRDSEQKLGEAQRIAHVGHWDRNVDSDFITWSDEVYRIFGISPGDEPVLTAERVRELIHPNDREKVFQTIMQAMQGGPRYNMEYRVMRPNGEVRIVHSQGDVIWDDSEKPRRVFGVVQDITERRQAEELIRQQSAWTQLLADLSQTFAEVGLDYQSVLATVSKRTAELIGDLCMISSFSQDGKQMTIDAIHHLDPRALELMQKASEQNWHANNQRIRRLLSNESLYVPMVDSEEFRPTLDPTFWPYFDEIGVSSFISMPLHAQGRVMGALTVLRDRSSRPYTPEDQAHLRDIADRAALTIQSARLFEQVQASQDRLRVLSQRLVDVQESEQKGLAREIHDDISQTLAVLVLQLGTARNLLPKTAQKVEAILARSEELTKEILEHTRSIIAGLRPQVLDDLGLLPALRHLGDELHNSTGAKVKVMSSRLPKRLPPPIEITLYRIVQETLVNIRKHAQAHHITISLVKEPDRMVLSVKDDGVGFEMQTNRSRKRGDMLINGGLVIPAGHFGLIGIQEQVTALGGTFQMKSAPGEGTLIQVELSL